MYTRFWKGYCVSYENPESETKTWVVNSVSANSGIKLHNFEIAVII